MSDKLEHYRDYARILIAGIRLFNRAAALFAPTLLARQFGGVPNHAVIYVLRLFGVRTIIVGIELLAQDEGLRASAYAPLYPFMLLIRSRRHLPVSRGNSLRASLSCSLQSRESILPWLS